MAAADVFLSYARKDRERAERLVEQLEREGWSVWWDLELRPGERFRRVIQERVKAARVVVVLWSETSIDSDWVCDEAEDAKELGTLVPVMIDGVRPPPGFGGLHAHSLVGWDGSRESALFAGLAEAIRERLGVPADLPEPPPEPPEPEPGQAEALDDDARAMLRESLEDAEREAADPDSDLRVLSALAVLGERLWESGAAAEALPYLERAAAVAANVGDGRWRLRVDHVLAEVLAAAGREDEAIERLEAVADASREPRDVAELFERSLARIDAVLADEDAPPGARYRVASGHLARLEWRLSRLEWTPALLAGIRPRYAHALAALGGLAAEVGRRDRALSYFEAHLAAAVESDPDWPAVLEQLGPLYLALGDECQAPGTDEAHRAAWGFYDLAREVFGARADVDGMRVAMRRTEQVALALDDMQAARRLRGEREALADAPAPQPQVTFPLSLAVVASVAFEEAAPFTLEATATVGLQNQGSLSWRAGRSIQGQAGSRGPASRSSAGTTLSVDANIAPGAIAQVTGVEIGSIEEKTEAYVRQSGAPWTGGGTEVSAPLPAEA